MIINTRLLIIINIIIITLLIIIIIIIIINYFYYSGCFLWVFLQIGWSLLQHYNFTRYHNHVDNAGRGCQQPNWTRTSNACKDCVRKEFFCHFEGAIFSKERGTGFSFGNSLQLRSRTNERQITAGVIKIISNAILSVYTQYFLLRPQAL